MDLRTQIELLTRCPLWAVTPEGFAALLMEIRGESFFQSRAFALAKPISLGNSQNNKVTVIPVQGVLTKDCSWCGTTYTSIANAAEQAAADPKVKRIVLAVDSPGGEVTGLPETAELIRRIAKVKPVSAIVEGTSASAAYWLTSQASDVTLTPSGEVGSVGVRMIHMDLSKMHEDAGIKVTEMQAGKFKTEWSPFKPLSEGARDDMQGRLDAVHADFISAVGQGRGARASRKITAARFGEGRMFSAKDAMDHGLVDAVQAPRHFLRDITPVGEEQPDLSRRVRLEVERNRF